ncbi:sodium-coupled monocarboxylate transporter 1-like [Haliotis asinina]|uniref:sodium-coupled monocarboxylate transporter 1-like n=1 Tax=Haliotis asinina TaxID=109174 RepID=UPI003531A15A
MVAKLALNKTSSMAKVSISAADYAVICGMLSLSVGIGLYYAVKGRRKITREEYLLGGRRLSVIPVTLSLIVTYMSSTSFVGMPAESFSSGYMIVHLGLGCTIGMGISMFMVVPLMHSLRLSSLYEYFHLRFGSVVLRRCICVVGMWQNILYTAVILIPPAISIRTVADLPWWVSVLLVGAIATLYTAIGGLKGVVAVDVFQALVMVVGLYATLFKGVYAVGGTRMTWDLAVEGGRVPPVDFSVDPRVRHSFWALVVGGGIQFIAYTFDQSAVQRMGALPGVRQAKIAYAFMGIAVGVYITSVSFLGLVAYSFYTVQGCDPFKAGYLQNRNQLVPYFMMEMFNGLPGMSGLFLATIFSTALSSVSSLVNGLAANTIEDLLLPVFDRYNTTENRKILIAKISVFFYGGVSVCLSFGAWSMPGTVIQAAMAISGACSGPILGVFLLGAAIPWGNITGAAVGMVVSLMLNLWIGLGGVMYGRRPVLLPPAPGNSCRVLDTTNVTSLYIPDPFRNNTNHADITTSFPNSVPGNVVDIGGNSLYNISYLYYAPIGCLVAFSVGLLASLATKHSCEPVRDERLLFPFVRRFSRLGQTNEPQQNGKLTDPVTHSMEGLQTHQRLITAGVFDKPVSTLI